MKRTMLAVSVLTALCITAGCAASRNYRFYSAVQTKNFNEIDRLIVTDADRCEVAKKAFRLQDKELYFRYADAINIECNVIIRYGFYALGNNQIKIDEAILSDVMRRGNRIHEPNIFEAIVNIAIASGSDDFALSVIENFEPLNGIKMTLPQKSIDQQT